MKAGRLICALLLLVVNCVTPALANTEAQTYFKDSIANLEKILADQSAKSAADDADTAKALSLLALLCDFIDIAN